MDASLVGVTEAVDILRSGEVKALDNIYDLEALVFLARQSRKQVEYYKDLKKRRIQAIDNEINKLEHHEAIASQVILETLRKHKENTVRFPGIGKATKKKKNGNWIIADEKSLLQILQKEKEFDNVVEVKVENIIKKKELNKLLDVWNKIDKVPDSVNKEEDSETISYTFEKEPVDLDIPIKNKSMAAVAFGDEE